MENDLKILLNNLIYKKLGLDVIESKINEFGIKNKKIINSSKINIDSKYFFLSNNVYVDNLTESEKIKLFELLENLNDEFSLNNLYNYLESIIEKLLFEKNSEKYIYYGEKRMNNLVPSDSIALTFQYLKYDYSEEQIEKNEDFIVDVINYIQDVLGPSKKAKVAIIECDEIKREMIRII